MAAASTTGQWSGAAAVRAARSRPKRRSRIRADLRRRDACSSRWIERLEARIDRLAAEIRLTAEMNRDHDRVP